MRTVVGNGQRAAREFLDRRATWGWHPREQFEQPFASPLDLAVEAGLRLGVAFTGVVGQFLDVDEHCLGHPVHPLRWYSGLGAGLGQALPGDPRAEPECGLQRVQRSALAHFAAAEGPVCAGRLEALGFG